jgi:hypothetical protein
LKAVGAISSWENKKQPLIWIFKLSMSFLFHCIVEVITLEIFADFKIYKHIYKRAILPARCFNTLLIPFRILVNYVDNLINLPSHDI